MKDTTRTAAIALLAVFAVAFAAASLDATVTPDRSGPERPGGGNGTGPGGFLPPPPDATPLPGNPIHLPYVGEVLTVLALLAGVGFVAYVVVYRREALTIIVAVAVLLALLVLLFQLLSAPSTPQAMSPGDGSLFGGAGGGGGDADTAGPAPPPALLFLVVGVVAVGVVLVLFRPTSDDRDADATGPDDGGAERAAVGRAAGRAADRLEAETDVDNEVYRTWREMTDLLDVENPETSTPGEFAAAAVEAGLGREDVDRLTRLFEAVRYGGERASEAQERQAVAVFRRIEERYAEEDP